MSLVFTPEGTPASPQEGEVYYDSSADKLKVRDASAFREVVSKNSSGEIDGTISSNATFPGPGTGADGGHIIQVKSSTFTGNQSIAVTDGITDITNLSCTLTIASGNKILIMANIEVGFSEDAFGGLHVTDGSNNVLVQNTTAINTQKNASVALTPPDADAGDVYQSKSFSFHHLWTPSSGTTHTVKIRGICERGSGDSIWINRMEDNSNADHHIRGTSSLTIFEVQA